MDADHPRRRRARAGRSRPRSPSAATRAVPARPPGRGPPRPGRPRGRPTRRRGDRGRRGGRPTSRPRSTPASGAFVIATTAWEADRPRVDRAARDARRARRSPRRTSASGWSSSAGSSRRRWRSSAPLDGVRPVPRRVAPPGARPTGRPAPRATSRGRIVAAHPRLARVADGPARRVRPDDARGRRDPRRGATRGCTSSASMPRARRSSCA